MSEDTQEITEKGEGTQEATQESAEDLKTQISGLQAQLGEKDTKIQSLDKAISKRQGYDEGIAKIHERLNTQEDGMAVLADGIDELRGVTPEQPSPGKVGVHQEKLRQDREQAGKPGEKTSKVDPNAERFFSYCEDVDLHIDYDSFEGCAPLVKEALGEGRGFKDALKYVRDKVKASQGQDVDKRAKEIAEGLVEQKLKEYGLTAAGAGGPTAGGKDLTGMSPMQLAQDAYSKKEK